MMFLERLAERKIEQAIAKGQLANLPGKGKPIPEEPGIAWVAPELRTAYRILKNAGYLPEELQVLKEIAGITDLLRYSAVDSPENRATAARLRLLLQRLGEIRSERIWMAEAYCSRIAERLAIRSAAGRPDG